MNTNGFQVVPVLTAFALSLGAAPAALAQVPAMTAMPGWTTDDIAALRRAVASAPQDALPVLSTAELDRAAASGDARMIGEAASDLALRLAKLELVGTSSAAQKGKWAIVDTDAGLDVEPMLDVALAAGTVDAFFEELRPQHPDYAALRAAYATETDPARRTTLARNMERWRWMPHSLGSSYVLVNIAAFQARLWRGGKQVGEWRTINGKPSTPTPVFRTTITGVTFNPWWEVPASIVRESVGALVRNHPASARARGFVVQGGRYRQAPGPGNALGLMKLVMPNPYSVFMHDTSNRNLFAQDNRALSHGCVRVGDAIGYAATLLDGAVSQSRIDAILASRQTTTVDLAHPLTLYIAYFTAGPDATGKVMFYKDIYHRDDGVPAPKDADIPCCN
ncbi:MAG: L,D-transpeptidase family protein [Sphingomonadales bacterium]|nr:L,D-transpeptidase family protein [Sphingomonadales bacterium]MDE2567319.1 L,D-transpeptidase family protein [Sphingomonadales bacterium]